jgi:hypothetical protein
MSGPPTSRDPACRAVPRRPVPGGIRFALTALAVWALLLALHPVQDTFWFDVGQRVDEVRTLPLSLSGAVQAIRLQAERHSPNYVRPVRAIQWLVLAKILGPSPQRFYLANVLSLGLAIACLMEIARRLGARAWVVGLCFAVSYVSVLPLIFIGFGFTLVFGFLGLLAYFANRPWGCFALLLIAGLSHETMLALTLVPLAHAVVERTPRQAAYVAAAVIPVYLGCRVVHAAIFGGASLWTSWGESAVRVGFAFASGGLPLEPVRALPWFPPFLRVRQLLSTGTGIASLAAVCAPSIALTALACRRVPGRRMLFYLAWAALGFFPLLLPVTTPEAYHLSVAVAAVFLLWASQPPSKVFVVALAAWLLVHGWARERLFYRDLPIMAEAVRALEAVKDDPRAELVNVPVQVGPHYAMLPDLGVRGCFVDPLWIWSSRTDGDLEAEKAAGRRIIESGTSFIRPCR